MPVNMDETIQVDVKLDRDLLKITDAELNARLRRVRPLIMRDNGKLYKFKLPDLRNEAFTWEVDFTRRYHAELTEVMVTDTHHTCAYYGFFKPSIAEVLAQLPDDPRIDAFYIERGSARISRDGDGHIAKTHWLHRIRK